MIWVIEQVLGLTSKTTTTFVFRVLFCVIFTHYRCLYFEIRSRKFLPKVLTWDLYDLSPPTLITRESSWQIHCDYHGSCLKNSNFHEWVLLPKPIYLGLCSSKMHYWYLALQMNLEDYENSNAEDSRIPKLACQSH